MAAKKKSKKEQQQFGRAVGYGLVGSLPIGSTVMSYKGARTAGMGRGASAGMGAAGTIVPIIGTFGGGYHGFNKHPNVRNAKTAVRASGRNRVQKKPYYTQKRNGKNVRVRNK